MAEVKVSIGGREFEVACHDGEEHYLQSAAALLDNEASALNDALGRMPETRMLLMSGLMLADKTASLEDQLKNAPTSDASSSDEGARKRATKAESQVSALQAELAELKAEIAELQAKSDSKAKEAAENAKAAANSAKLAESKAKEASEMAHWRDAAVETMQSMIKRVEAAAEAAKKAG